MSLNVKVVQPSGLLDSESAPQFREQINQYVANNAEIIIVDFQNVTFMDSSGLGALVMSLKTVRTAGGQIFVCSINEQIRMLFELTNMDRVFAIFSNREELEKHLLQ
jgi:anti-sigma B factor antagonist